MQSIIIHDLTGRIYSIVHGESRLPQGLTATLIDIPDSVQTVERMEGNTPVFQYIPQSNMDGYTKKLSDIQAKMEDATRLYKNAAQVLSETATDEQALLIKDVYDEWSGDGVQYRKGQRVRYKGDLWTVITSHVSQDNWMPSYAPSLFSKVINTGIAGGTPDWQQPDSTNPYMKDEEVKHNGKYYISLIDNNVWEPGEIGSESLWKEIILYE